MDCQEKMKIYTSAVTVTMSQATMVSLIAILVSVWDNNIKMNKNTKTKRNTKTNHKNLNKWGECFNRMSKKPFYSISLSYHLMQCNLSNTKFIDDAQNNFLFLETKKLKNVFDTLQKVMETIVLNDRGIDYKIKEKLEWSGELSSWVTSYCRN